MSFGAIKAWIIGAAVLLAVVAAFSRIATMKESPQYIKNAAQALAKLFNGAFGY